MALTYKATFRPERRKYKETGELIEDNVPLLLDLSYQGRSWYNTGIRLQHITDFDVKAQKMIPGKKAIENKDTLSATKVSDRLNSIKGYISEAFNDAKALKVNITAKYLIEQMQIKSGNKKIDIVKENTFIQDFISTYENWCNKNMIGLARYKHYKVTQGILERFLRIKKLKNITSKEFTSDMLLSFQDFLLNEYTYIDVYPDVYNGLSEKRLPKERSKNTIASKLTGLKTFFNEMEEKDMIPVNPFRKIAKREREVMLRESYDEPVYLSIDELLTVVNKNCPKELERVRDCFLLQCAIGCRVDDFNNLTWDNINQKDNFCYVHYVPSKTSHGTDLKPIDTPLVKFAYDIIIKHKEMLPDNLLVQSFIGNLSGNDGYNKQIKKLLTHYEINRNVITRKNGELASISISDIASSKLCRKTHVDILAKVSLNKYSSGLHEQGSKAVDRYTGLNLEEKYKLYCMAFRQDEYICK
jgi:integrase